MKQLRENIGNYRIQFTKSQNKYYLISKSLRILFIKQGNNETFEYHWLC